jgi:hypothetical protein
MRRFVLARHQDPSGISGVGIVAEGVALTGGTAFLHWLTEHETFVHWPGGVDAILAVHGHEGSTIARWLDEEPPPSTDWNWREEQRQIDPPPSKYEHDEYLDPRD